MKNIKEIKGLIHLEKYDFIKYITDFLIENLDKRTSVRYNKNIATLDKCIGGNVYGWKRASTSGYNRDC